MPVSRNITEEAHIIELLRERFYINYKISPDILKYDIKFVRDHFDHISESILIQLEKHIWQQKTKEDCFYNFPKTLWQLIKEFYFPLWLKRFFRPVKFDKIKISVDLNIKYLDIPVSLQNRSPVLQIASLNCDVPSYVREE